MYRSIWQEGYICEISGVYRTSERRSELRGFCGRVTMLPLCMEVIQVFDEPRSWVTGCGNPLDTPASPSTS